MTQDEIIVAKKGKKAGRGKQEIQTNIAPLMQKITIEEKTGMLVLRVILRAQEPGLNPRYLIKAVEQYASSFAPDFVRYYREETYDGKLQLFR